MRKGKADMKLRIARPEDAGELLNIYKYYVENTAVTFEIEVPTVEEFRERITNTLKHYPYIVAIEDGGNAGDDSNIGDGSNANNGGSGSAERIIGYAYAGKFRPRAAFIYSVETSIYVRNDMRRSGAGKLLYEELERLLEKQNVLKLYAAIATMNRNEDPHLTFDSVKFHERIGYKACGRFDECGNKFGSWYGLMVMEKSLEKTPEKPGEFIPFSLIKEHL